MNHLRLRSATRPLLGLGLGLALGCGGADQVRTVALPVSADVGWAYLSIPGDLDGDGTDDLAMVGWPADLAGGVIQIWLGERGGPDERASSTVELPDADGVWNSGAGLGDVDGDGRAEIAAGGCHDDQGCFVWRYPGGPDGVDEEPAELLVLHAGEARFTTVVVSAAGDVDGDGAPDLAAVADVDTSSAGRLIFYGATGEGELLPAVDGGYARRTLEAGDVTGDGYADLLFEAEYDYDVGYGPLYLVPGGAEGLAEAPAQRLERSISYSKEPVSPMGDLDGDGFGDLAIGEFLTEEQGGYRVLAGGPDGFLDEPLAARTGEDGEDTALGFSVAGLGDADGDGAPDLLVTAPDLDWAQGGALLFLGEPPGMSDSPARVIGCGPDVEGAGFAAAGGGDLDADGLPDAVLGGVHRTDTEAWWVLTVLRSPGG